ncbi:response regulator [Nocardia thraciensis]
MHEILSSVATLLWPVLFLVALLMFRGPVGRVIRSAERREFTLNVGGQEIGMKELSDQQDDMIADLQTQLSRLQQEVANLRSARSSSPPTPAYAWSPPRPDAPAPYTGELLAGDESGAADVRAAPAAGAPSAGSDDADPPPAEIDFGTPVPTGPVYGEPPTDEDDGPSAYGDPGAFGAAAPGSARPTARSRRWGLRARSATPPVTERPREDAGAEQSGPGSRREPTANAVLWVDDKPENSALIVDRLERNGIRVDIARSTAEALTLLDKGRGYGAIVTDWGRTENGVRVSDAGRRLLEEVRDRDISTPMIVYTSVFGISAARRDSASEAGARLVTGSTTRLTGELAALGLLPG